MIANFPSLLVFEYGSIVALWGDFNLWGEVILAVQHTCQAKRRRRNHPQKHLW